MPDLLDHLKNIQRLFRVKLKSLRTAAAYKRATDAREKWLKLIADKQKWKQICQDSICSYCGYTNCRCNEEPTLIELVQLLQRLSGVNPARGLAPIVHDEDKSTGPVGYRVCGKDAWDNVIRASEESR